MTYSVTRSPARLRSRDGNFCYYGDALSTIFLLFCCALLPTFSHFLLRCPGMFIFFVFLRLCSSRHLSLLSPSTHSYVKTTTAITTTTNDISSQVRHTYVTKGTYAFIYSTYGTREPGTCTYHIYSYIHGAWYELVPACNSSFGWNFSLLTRGHITTKLHELNIALDVSKGEWR